MPSRLHTIIGTTDIHSRLDRADGLIVELQSRAGHSLRVDAGDFFEGTGYYQEGAGALERRLLTSLYDVIAPGNHGWQHYLQPDLHAITVNANTTTLDTDEPLFSLFRTVRLRGRRVAVTGVIGEEAFDAVRVHHRAGHRWKDPATVLNRLVSLHHDVDDWVVLSHSGFDADLALAAAVPDISVIFSGHCHSPRPGPITVGRTLVVKGAEYAVGYALANPTPTGWTATTALFPTDQPVPAPWLPFTRDLAATAARLDQPLGPVAAPWRGICPDRHTLVKALADRLHRLTGMPVLLNDTLLRPHPLGEQLRAGDLLALEPFANRLVIAPTTGLDDPRAWQTWLTRHAHPDLAGPLVTAPALNHAPPTLLTSDYLADTFLRPGHREAPVSLTHALRDVLLSRPLS
ncbi:metallophosphoesterase [Streptomyces sp. NPDC059134]|uniref:metallophosphoesterase n=1 Tax=Streptomyces sp. NPDC059134 TaxID=3346738 RepID=UPI0036B0A9D1